MAARKKIRLFKIASEINIGKDAIIEFLNAKGFDIQNKPTAILAPDMVDAVYEKFKKEKLAIEKQREKLEKHKKVRKPAEKDSAEAQDSEPESADVQAAEEESAKQEESVPKEPETQIEEATEEAPAKKAPKSAKSKEKPKDGTPQVGDKISLEDLEAKKPKRSSKKIRKEDAEEKPAAKKKETAKTKEPEKLKTEKKAKTDIKTAEETEIKVVENKSDEIEKTKAKESKSKSAKKETTKTKTKAKKTEESEKDLVAKKIEEAIKEKVGALEENKDGSSVVAIVEDSEKLAGKTAEKTPEELEEIRKIEEEIERQSLLEEQVTGVKQKEKTSKKRKKRKKIAEVELDADGKGPQLRGLTIVGKIDLKKDEEKSEKQPRRKKGQIDEQEDDKPKKPRKKKRKTKAKVLDVTAVRETSAKKPDKKRKRKKSVREMIKDEDVEAAIKKTLAGMETSGPGTSSRAKMRQKKKAEREEKELKKIEEQEHEAQILELTEFVTTSDLANLMQVTANDIIMKCMELGLMVSINQRLDKDTLILIADDYGFEVQFLDEKAVQSLDDVEDDDEDLEPRSPIVTIMGHVDHGKTSLLDYIRHSSIVAGESGGITQHIGAYRVDCGNRKYITFLDTPGHEAFTAMRARGAQVTDIVILVVSADDSVMPQTIEAISHAQAAHVPIVVAINKIDKPDAQPDRIKQQLADHNILVEDWGGTYQSVEISAKQGTNIDILLEKILLESEMLELKANPDRLARATVVEANMDKGLGSVSTVIVQKGTLKVGDSFIAGVHSGKIRAMFDERGRKVEEAGPTIPVRAIGFDGLPEAGDILAVVSTDSEAKAISNQRSQRKREQEFRQVHHVTLDDISAQIQVGGVKDLNLIIKADVSGSVEALSDSLLKLSTDEVRVDILHKGVGSITETDIMLAAASSAVIVGFHISPTAKARKAAEAEKVDIRLYSIIYDCINEIRMALEGLLTPDTAEEITSTVEIRKIFKISKTGVIGGCHVTSGKITRNDRVRVLRDGLPVFKGTLHSLKREKDDVKEVDAGYECGIMLEGFQDIQEGDIIEGFKIVEIKRSL